VNRFIPAKIGHFRTPSAIQREIQSFFHPPGYFQKSSRNKHHLNSLQFTYLHSVKNEKNKAIQENDGVFIFRDTSFNELTYGTLLRYADSSVIQLAPRNPQAVTPVEMEVNKCTFLCNHGYQSEHQVVILQTEKDVVLSCSCGMCTHQGFALFHAMENPNFRIFFDEEQRVKVIAKHAADYGIVDPKLMNDSFSLALEHKQVVIRLRVPELIGLTAEKRSELQQKLVPLPFSPENGNTPESCIPEITPRNVSLNGHPVHKPGKGIPKIR
jgi:hypothetical protein